MAGDVGNVPHPELKPGCDCYCQACYHERINALCPGDLVRPVIYYIDEMWKAVWEIDDIRLNIFDKRSWWHYKMLAIYIDKVFFHEFPNQVNVCYIFIPNLGIKITNMHELIVVSKAL